MKKQTPKAKRLTESKAKHLKTVKRKQLSEIKKSIGKYLNEALNKDLKDFGTDLKKFLEEKGLTVKLGQGSAQPLYEPISKNDKYAALQLQDASLHVIVNDGKIDVLEDLIKKYNLSTLTNMKKSGGWDEDPNKKTQSKGEIYLEKELKQGRKGKAFELVITRFDPSNIMEKTNLKFHPLNEMKKSLKKYLNENDGTPAAKQISTNKPLRNNILKYIESKLKPGQSVERLFQMEDVAKEYIKNYVTEKEPHYKAIADSKNDMHFWYQTMQQHLQGGLDEELKFHPLNEMKNSLKKSIKSI
tara:strand:+ start:573 stop:1472 length:900 start_codon:yes stop_codon:yes gene_type:complete